MIPDPTDVAGRIAGADPIERQAAVLGLALACAAAEKRVYVVEVCFIVSFLVNCALLGALVGAIMHPH